MYAISQSLVLDCVSRAHKQHTEVLVGGAYLITGHGDVEFRKEPV